MCLIFSIYFGFSPLDLKLRAFPRLLFCELNSIQFNLIQSCFSVSRRATFSLFIGLAPVILFKTSSKRGLNFHYAWSIRFQYCHLHPAVSWASGRRVKLVTEQDICLQPPQSCQAASCVEQSRLKVEPYLQVLWAASEPPLVFWAAQCPNAFRCSLWTCQSVFLVGYWEDLTWDFPKDAWILS